MLTVPFPAPNIDRESAHRKSACRTIAFPEGGGLLHWPRLIAPCPAEQLHGSLREAVPWTLNLNHGHVSQRFTLWMETIVSHRPRAPQKSTRLFELLQEISSLIEPAALRGGFAHIDTVGFHRLASGRNSFTFDGRKASDTARGGPAAILAFGATRHVVLQHRQTHRQVRAALSHGSLLAIDDETRAQWTLLVPSSPRTYEEHLSVSMHVSAPSAEVSSTNEWIPAPGP